MQKNIKTYTIREEKELDDMDISLTPWDRIAFSGDLGAGKSTMIRHILRKYMDDPTLVVRSPTYTYYQKYSKIVGSSDSRIDESDASSVPDHPTIPPSYHPAIYHMDLYRIEDYETWVSIGGEEIAEDPTTIMLIEWPEILGDRISYTSKISIEVMENGERKVMVEKIAK
jgi:tRNA A37 threonylcarbamoyladenosine biosynthesis protein TsaE